MALSQRPWSFIASGGMADGRSLVAALSLVIRSDVDPAVAEKAAWMAPNPGGVGPMTRVMLLANVVQAAERAAAPEDWAGERAHR